MRPIEQCVADPEHLVWDQREDGGLLWCATCALAAARTDADEARAEAGHWEGEYDDAVAQNERFRAELADARRALGKVERLAEKHHNGLHQFAVPTGTLLALVAASRSSSPDTTEALTTDAICDCRCVAHGGAGSCDPTCCETARAHRATEAVTEPETTSMRWLGSIYSPDHPNDALAIVKWIRREGGEAAFEPAMTTTQRMDYGEPPHQPARIVITGPNGNRVMAPGDEAVKGERWFYAWDESKAMVNCYRREFTVRRPTDAGGER